MQTPHNSELHAMCLAHFNEPMIAHDRIVRCIGYGETGVDCYVITKGNNGKIVWNTCVGGYFFLDRLKGQGYVKAWNGEDWDDLTRLDSSLECGGATKEPNFRLDLRHDDMEDGGRHRLLTPTADAPDSMDGDQNRRHRKHHRNRPQARD